MPTLDQVQDILLGLVIDEIQAGNGDENFCYVGTYPGTSVPGDIGAGTHGCGGSLWSRFGGMGPSVSFPNIGITANNCAYELVYTIEVGIFRVAPVGQAFGNNYQPPTAEQNGAISKKLIDDGHFIERAMKRFIREGHVEDALLGTYGQVGPEGGLVGGSWTISVGGLNG